MYAITPSPEMIKMALELAGIKGTFSNEFIDALCHHGDLNCNPTEYDIWKKRIVPTLKKKPGIPLTDSRTFIY